MTPPMLLSAARDDGRTYVLDMILQLAKLSRRFGETPIAIQLEAILAADRATVRNDGLSRP